MDAIRRGEYDTGGPPQPSHWNPGDGPNELCKIEMPQFASRALMDLVSHRDLGAWAAGVAGARTVQVWWVQLLYKPVGEPGERQNVNIGWHQDRHYWRAWEEGSELFTAWVALSDVTRDAGPMRFVRGSHRWGLVDKGGFYEQDLEAQRQDIQPPTGERWEEVAAILPPGGASFHHNLTLHGSNSNSSEGAAAEPCYPPAHGKIPAGRGSQRGPDPVHRRSLSMPDHLRSPQTLADFDSPRPNRRQRIR